MSGAPPPPRIIDLVFILREILGFIFVGSKENSVSPHVPHFRVFFG